MALQTREIRPVAIGLASSDSPSPSDPLANAAASAVDGPEILPPVGAFAVPSADIGMSEASPEATDQPGSFEGELMYVPRSILTRAPAPMTPVFLRYPSFDADEHEHYSAQLTLFIASSGKVDRVKLDSPLPPELEGAARRAFLGVQFTPGELNGRPVRSLIRVEVQFDRGDTTPE